MSVWSPTRPLLPTFVLVLVLVAGCSNDSDPGADSPEALAETFFNAALNDDLDAAAATMAPDNQPNEWGDVFRDSTAVLDSRMRNWVQLAPDLTDCQGIDFEQVIREGQDDGVAYALVSVTFDTPCGTHARSGSAMSLSEVEPVSTVFVLVDYSAGRWYVSAAEAEG